MYNQLDIRISIFRSAAITAVRCSTHSIETSVLSDNFVGVRHKAISSDNDMIVIIDSDSSSKPYALMEIHSTFGTAAVQLAFTPRALSLYQAEAAPSFDHDKSQIQLIFLMDCSGSMTGSSITTLRRTMHIILRSLDTRITFNLFKFGSSYDRLFGGAMQYDDTSLSLATEYINHLDATFGGTEIFVPLTDILLSAHNRHIPQQVFLLTDGQVTNVEELVRLVKSHSNSRIFTFGIGSAVDSELIKRVAEASGGAYEFVSGESDNDYEMSRKVLRQVQRSI